MRADELLLLQTRHHYRWVDRATSDVGAEPARREILPGRPTIAWQVGHLIEEVESTAEALCGLSPPPSPLPESWQELRRRWEASSGAALRALAGLGPGELAAPPGVPIHPGFEESLATRRHWWTGHVFHLAYHLGQVGLLRAALGLDRQGFAP